MVSRPYINHPDVAAERRPNGSPNPTDAARRIPDLLKTLQEQAAWYAAIRKDAAAAQLRATLAKLALAALGALVAASMVAVSVWLLLSGIARGLGLLFGDRVWLGYLVTGLVILVAFGAVTWFGIRHWKRSSHDSTVEKYDRLKQEQAQKLAERTAAQPGPVAAACAPASAPMERERLNASRPLT